MEKKTINPSKKPMNKQKKVSSKFFHFKSRILENSSKLISVFFLVILTYIILVLLSNEESAQYGKMVLFSALFIITFILVAKYHEKQLTIVFLACAVSLLLALILIEDFDWIKVVLPTDPAFGGYMEWEVLAVVFGMSILVEATSKTGLFDYIIIRILKFSKGEVFPLFGLTFLLTFALSTVLANVTAMILVSSMILTVCNGLDYDPTPFLLSSVLGTSLAGMATLVSSLPAIMVGSYANISFIEFLIVSVPFLLVTIPVSIIYMKRVFPPEKIPLGNIPFNNLDSSLILSLDEWGVVEDRKKFNLAALSLVVTIMGFLLSDFLGIPIGVVAILGGIIAMLLTNIDEHSLFSELSWDTLLFFAGLFILVGTLEGTHVLEEVAVLLKELSQGNLFLAGILILIISSLFSGILDNIPVTAALVPVISEMNEIPAAENNPRFLWFMLVFAGAFGGGLTPFGSAASIIALSILKKEDHPLNFKYFIVRLVPISIILLVFSGIYLSFLAFVLGVI